MQRCITGMIVLALACPVPALAQPTESLSFTTGIALPLAPGVWSDIYRPGVSFNVALDVPANENVTLRPRVFYTHLRLDRTEYLTAIGEAPADYTLSGGSTAILYAAVDGRIGLPDSRPVAPFVAFGAGFFRRSERTLEVHDGREWSTIEAGDPDVGFGIDFGVGTTVAITPEVAARGEVQYLAGFLEDDTFAVAPITLGVTFRL